MHGQEIFQVFTDLNHSDLGLCTGYKSANKLSASCVRTACCKLSTSLQQPRRYYQTCHKVVPTRLIQA